MSREVLLDREKAFEYEFFHRVDQQLIKQLRERLDSEERIESLSRCTGIGDKQVLQELLGIDINHQTIVALSLVPLVRVAWADGKMDAPEREAILQAAEAEGHASGSASYRLLESWLERRPDNKLYLVYRDYLHALLATLAPASKETLRRDLASRSRGVRRTSRHRLGAPRGGTHRSAAFRPLRPARGSWQLRGHRLLGRRAHRKIRR